MLINFVVLAVRYYCFTYVVSWLAKLSYLTWKIVCEFSDKTPIRMSFNYFYAFGPVLFSPLTGQADNI